MYVTGTALSVSISLTESFACLQFMFVHLCTNESISVCIYLGGLGELVVFILHLQ